MKVHLLSVACLLLAQASHAQVTIFSENFGTPSGTTAITSYTGYQNQGTLTFSGTGDLRTTSASSGYTGASGGGNVFLSSVGNPTFIISGIDTSGYQSGSIALNFGAAKTATADDMTKLTVGYSTDGVNYTSVSVPAQGSGTSWRSVTLTSLAIPASSSLSLKWTNSGSSSGYRLDDVKLTATAIPEPSTYAAIVGAASLVGAIWWRRRQSGPPPPSSS